MNKLKEALSSAPVLRLPDLNQTFVVHTDASNFAIGAVLQQDFGKGLQPIAYESRKLNNTEQRYSTYERELLSIAHACLTWKHYLGGKHFTVRTDHHSLRYLFTQNKFTGRAFRYMEQLQEFDFDIEHIPGWKNLVADALSRRDEEINERPLRKDKRKEGPEFNSLVRITIRNSDVIKNQIRLGNQGDSFFNQVKAAAVDRGSGETSIEMYNREFKIDTGLMYVRATGIRGTDHGESDWLVYVPDVKRIRCKILEELHDVPTAGHLGYQKTVEAVKRAFWWRGLTADVKDYVMSCQTCQEAKYSKRPPGGLLQPLEIPTAKWRDISVDFIVELPKTTREHDAIMTVVDRATKMTHIVPTMTDITAPDAADLFKDFVWKYHGIPRTIVSDRDPKFISLFWRRLMRLLGTRLRFSTAYHPQTDGQSEKMNDLIEQTLRAYTSFRANDWDQRLTTVEYAINNSVNASTGYTPFFLNYGYHPDSPLDIILDRKETKLQTVNEWVSKMEEDFKEAQEILKSAQETQKKFADRRLRQEEFNVGDRVMLSTGKRKQAYLRGPGVHPDNKFRPRYVGPFQIDGRISQNAYLLRLPASWDAHPVFHISRLKKWNEGERIRKNVPATHPKPVKRTQDIYKVDRILDTRISRGQRQYLIKWEGYQYHDATWEPVRNLQGCEGLLTEFWSRRGGNPDPAPSRPQPSTSSPPASSRPEPRRSSRRHHRGR